MCTNRFTKNCSNVLENHKLIIFKNKAGYHGIWVEAKCLRLAQERFAKQTHLIADSPIDGAKFLNILVSDINVVNEEYFDRVVRNENK